MDRLAAVVRRCRYGVLIRVGCPLRAPRCRQSAVAESGVYLLVQPCGLDRRPRGAATVVGPVLSADDVEAVATWLEHDGMDADLLNRRLRSALLCSALLCSVLVRLVVLDVPEGVQNDAGDAYISVRVLPADSARRSTQDR
jgi:hypothetical protein